MANQIKEQFSVCKEFDAWLQKNHGAQWYTELATYLAKLPMKAARNVVTDLYHLVSQALYVAAHPVKGLNSLAKDIIIFLDTITRPDNWVLMGATYIATRSAQGMLLSGGPLSLIGLGIGGALIAGGVAAEMLSILLSDHLEKYGMFVDRLKTYARQLPEAVLTGALIGFLIGGMRRASESSQPQPLRPLDKVQPQQPSQPLGKISATARATFEKIPDVAEYGGASWDNLVKLVRGITVEEAKAIASNSPDINYFFFTKGIQMILGEPRNCGLNPGFSCLKVFHHGDVAFFSGKPWWGTAPYLADGYIKA